MPPASSFALLPPILSLLPVPVAPVSSLTSLGTVPLGGTPALSPPRLYRSLPVDGDLWIPPQNLPLTGKRPPAPASSTSYPSLPPPWSYPPCRPPSTWLPPTLPLPRS